MEYPATTPEVVQGTGYYRVDLAASHANATVVQWVRAALKVHDPQFIEERLEWDPIVWDRHSPLDTAMHHAARYGHNLVVEQLLKESPELAEAVDEFGRGAFGLAAENGDEVTMAVLLRMRPDLVENAVNGDIVARALQVAARDGHDKVVAQLLAANPSLAHAINEEDGWNALHQAAAKGHEAVLKTLLATEPGLIRSVTGDKNDTVLHLICTKDIVSRELVAELFALHPIALRGVNAESQTPFDVAVTNEAETAIECLQWEVTLGEIVDAFTACERNYEDRFAPLVKTRCALLFEALNRDVAGTVFEYLGFDTLARHSSSSFHTQKRNLCTQKAQKKTTSTD